jgi:hypothetical protein
VIHALAWLVVVEFDLFHLFLVINRLQKFVTDRADILHISLGDQLILKSCYRDIWYLDVKSTIVHYSYFTFYARMSILPTSRSKRLRLAVGKKLSKIPDGKLDKNRFL